MYKFWNFLLLVILFAACASDSKTNQESESDVNGESAPMEFQLNDNGLVGKTQADASTQPPPPSGAVNIPAGPDGITHHYICVDRCAGGHSESPGTCPVCGKSLSHNQAWHDVQNAGQQANPMGPRVETAPAPNVPSSVNDAPAQVNVPAGPDGIVHHYICQDRCSGGHSANPGKCPKCNKTLAHNQAFHNQ